MNLEELFEEHKIELDMEEALLIDWVLTLHQFDESLLDWLMKPEVRDWREQAGRVIVVGSGSITLSDDDIKVLLALIPVVHRFSEKNVGLSLKTKLYSEYLRIGGKHDNQAKSQTSNKTPDSSESENQPV